MNFNQVNSHVMNPNTGTRILLCVALCSVLALLSPHCLRAQPAPPDPWPALAKYQFSQSREPLALIEEQIRKSAPADYPSLETKLLAVLKAPDTERDAKRYICRWLGIVGSAKCVPALAERLTDPDLSHPARIALEKLPDDDTAPTPFGMTVGGGHRFLVAAAAAKALREALPKLKGNLLVGVISSLGVRRDFRAVDSLRPLLRDPDPLVAAAAIAALGQIGTDEAGQILASAQVPNDLARALAHARIVAATRLAQAGNAARAAATFKEMISPTQPPAIRVAALKGLIAALPRNEAVALIISMMQGEDAAMRTATISAYAVSTDKGLKDSVAEQLPNLKPNGQLLLMGTLADQDDVAARGPVLTVLKMAGDEPLRVAALECLARHGEAEDVPLIVGLATETSGAVGAEAKRTLQRMGKPGVDAALVRLIEAPRPKERAVVLDTLASRRVESALPTLARLLQGADTALAIEAAKALGVLGKPEQLTDVAKVLAGADNATLRAATDEAAKQICRRAADLPRCATVLIAALRQAGAPAAKAALLPVLVYTGGEPALNEVLSALRDERAVLKAAAFRALVSWPEANAGPPLLELAKTTPDPSQAIVALRDGCLRLAEMEEVPLAQRLGLLRGVLDVAKRPEEKRRALAALSDLQSPGALELLQGCLRDPSLKADALKATIKLAKSMGGVYTRQCLAALEHIKAQADTDAARNELAQAINAVQAAGQSPEGFILAWLLSGPYTQADKDASALFDLAFAPEKPAAPAEWRPLAGDKTGVVDLGKVMPGENRVAYLRTVITSERDQDATLELGSDDGIKVWLNGQVVHANNVIRPCTPGQDKAPAKLKRGLNPLLLKVTQGGGEWAACARLRGPDGKPLSGVLIAPVSE